jgi:hypothetical protein
VATASVHQDFSESGVGDNRIDDEWVVSRVQDVTRVILLVEHDGLFGPIEETQGGGLRSVDLSVFTLSLSCRELCRTTTKDHKAVLHLEEPIVFVVTPLGI